MKRILILTEAGETGLGHLSRSIALNEEILDGKILCAKFGNVDIGEVEEFDWHNNEVFEKDFDSVVVDSYKMTLEKERELREKFENFIVFDDYNRREYLADLIINPSMAKGTIDYSNQKAKAIGGREYFSVRSSILENKKPKPITFLKNLLIFLGGNPDLELIKKIAENFKEEFVKTTVLVGTKEKAEEINTLVADIECVSALDGKALAQLFCSTDLAITAGGVLMGELLFCGVPLIAIEIEKNQENNIKALLQENILFEKIRVKDENILAKIKKEIERFQDEKIRKEISFKSQVLINGKGARNIAQKIASLGS